MFCVLTETKLMHLNGKKSNTSLRNSCGPCCDEFDNILTATSEPFGRFPLYTGPKPP